MQRSCPGQFPFDFSIFSDFDGLARLHHMAGAEKGGTTLDINENGHQKGVYGGKCSRKHDKESAV